MSTHVHLLLTHAWYRHVYYYLLENNSDYAARFKALEFIEE